MMKHFEKIREAKRSWLDGVINRQELLQIIRDNPASWTGDGGNAVTRSPLGDGEVVVFVAMIDEIKAQMVVVGCPTCKNASRESNTGTLVCGPDNQACGLPHYDTGCITCESYC